MDPKIEVVEFKAGPSWRAYAELECGTSFLPKESLVYNPKTL